MLMLKKALTSSFFNFFHFIVAKRIFFAIIIMHLKNAAVVQRLVPMLAMHMMTVRFRSVAPIKNNSQYFSIDFFVFRKRFRKIFINVSVIINLNIKSNINKYLITD